MEKSSWSKPDENKGENFIGRREVGYGIFTYGTAIADGYKEGFLENLSKDLEWKKSQKVIINIESKNYECTIDRPKSHSKESMYIRLIFSSELMKYLKKNLNLSYDYMVSNKIEGSKAQVKLPDEYKEFIDFYLGKQKNNFIMKLIKASSTNEDEEVKENGIPEYKALEQFSIITNYNEEESVDFIYNYILSQGYTYEYDLIKNIYLCLKTKPFLILSGISGTGKSKIIELFAEALGAAAENKRFNLIPVKPDWSDSTELLGYRNLEGKFIPGVITTICYEAESNKALPYFIVLDEMNLARVEYYFSDVLSLMETRKFNHEGNIITGNLLNKELLASVDNDAFTKYSDVYIPENVYIIGTVNMDETAFPFSRKVLDRANTIEFNKVNLDFDFDKFFPEEECRVLHNDFLKPKFLNLKDCAEYKETALKVIEKLKEVNNILEKYNEHFAYRVRDEIVFYIIYALKYNLFIFDEAFDICLKQKILPKISGSSSETLELLVELFQYLNDYKFSNKEYPEESELLEAEKNMKRNLSNEKLIYMIRRFIKDGFTSFWK